MTYHDETATTRTDSRGASISWTRGLLHGFMRGLLILAAVCLLIVAATSIDAAMDEVHAPPAAGTSCQ